MGEVVENDRGRAMDRGGAGVRVREREKEKPKREREILPLLVVTAGVKRAEHDRGG